MNIIIEDFIIQNTKINGKQKLGGFFKSFKYLACYNKAHGTKRGRMSKDVMYFSDLLYNSLNFRDIYSNKPKGTTRKE